MNSGNQIFRYVFAFLLILVFKTGFCKDNFLPGYVISREGDTLRGYIDYRNWLTNPEKISFKKELSGLKKNYTVADINGFSVANEIYIRAAVRIELTTNFTKELDYIPDLKFRTDTVFIQCIIAGPKSLYAYKHKSYKDQFYIKTDSAYELLVYKRYLEKRYSSVGNNSVTVDRTYLEKQRYETFIMENNSYLEQLEVFLGECPGITQYFKETQYEKKSLVKLFETYYRCVQLKIKFQKEIEPTKYEAKVFAGLSVTSLSLTGTGHNSLRNADFKSSTNFSGGLALEVILPRDFNKVSFITEAFYSSYKLEGKYLDYTNENEYTNTTTTLGLSYVKANLMMRYTVPVGEVKIFANGGVLFGIGISSTNKAVVERKFYSSLTTDEGEAMDYMRKREFGYDLGIGAKYKRYSAEIRYEKGNGMSDYMNMKSSTSRIYGFLGFRF